MKVDIHDPDLEALVRQSDGKVDGGTGFSHAAFAALTRNLCLIFPVYC